MSKDLIIRSNIETNESSFKSFGQLLWHRLNQLDDSKVCLIDGSTDERMTVNELKSRANSIAMALIGRGIEKTDIIAISGENSIQHLVLRFASYFMGNTVLSIYSSSGKNELEQSILTTGANIIAISFKSLKSFDEILKIFHKSMKLLIVFDGKHEKYVTFDQLLKEERDHTLKKIPHFDVNAEDIMLMLYSSGTTGAGKCIMQSHRSFIAAYERPPFDDYKPSTIGLLNQMIGIDGNMIITEIIYGSLLIIYPLFDTSIILGSIEKYRIEVIKGAFFPLNRLFNDKHCQEYDISSLRTVNTSGDFFPGHISSAIRDKYGINFIEWYGMSEFLYITKGANEHDEFIPGNVGNVFNGTQLKIVDLKTGQSVGPNIDGLICIRGNTLFSGYCNDVKTTIDAFDDEGWLNTGDIGHYDHKERLFITDRLVSFIKVTPYSRLSPIEVEHFLLTNECIEDVAVIGVNTALGAQWPRAYVVVKDGHSISAQQIVKYVSNNLSPIKQLKAGVVFVDRIHRTDMGKVDRNYYKNLVKHEVIE